MLRAEYTFSSNKGIISSLARSGRLEADERRPSSSKVRCGSHRSRKKPHDSKTVCSRSKRSCRRETASENEEGSCRLSSALEDRFFCAVLRMSQLYSASERER